MFCLNEIFIRKFSGRFLNIFLTLLGWHWLIKLYGFQVYNFITNHLYIVFCSSPQVKSLSIIFYSPLMFFYLPPIPFSSGNQHTVVRVWVSYSLLNLFTFSPSPTETLPRLIAVSLFSVFMSLFLLCSLPYFVH